MPTKNMSTPPTLAISRLEVSGLKSIRTKQAIDIRPLTILAGANSSGKSSMMQALLLLKQTLEADYDPGPLRISGPNADFTSADQLLFHSNKSSASERITIGLTTSRAESALLTFVRGSGRFPLEIDEQVTTAEGAKPLRLKPNTAQHSLLNNTISAETNRLFAQMAKEFGKGLTAAVGRNRCFLEVWYGWDGEPAQARGIGFLSFAPHVLPLIRGIIHLRGLRGNPERTYPISAVGETFAGDFQHYVASVVASWQSDSDDRLKQLGDDLSLLGLTWKAESRSVDATRVELRVGRLPKPQRGGAQDLVNIADVGFGVSQTLPVVVSLLAAAPGQMVYIEQPEIHLHPRAQVAMASLLANAARRGVRVVIETHSALLILGIQTLIAREELGHDLVKLHWFHRDDSTGETTVESADFDDAGRFGDWPEDFADVSLRAESEYLDAVEKRLLNGARV